MATQVITGLKKTRALDLITQSKKAEKQFCRSIVEKQYPAVPLTSLAKQLKKGRRVGGWGRKEGEEGERQKEEVER